MFSVFITDILEQLNDMNVKLEEIQKSLDMYLETKRQIFPRFYFLSNDDLLEILGQSKNPEAVQTHLKKCFDNIRSLKMSRVSRERILFYLGARCSSIVGCPLMVWWVTGSIPHDGPVELFHIPTNAS